MIQQPIKQEQINKIKSFFEDHKEQIAIILIAICLCVVIYSVVHRVTEPKNVPIHTVTEITPQTIKQVIPGVSNSEAKDISRRIEYVHDNTAPTYHYYTVSQEASDKTAEAYAQAQHADNIVKQTKEVSIPNTDQKVIENDYYAINMERKHAVAVGTAYINDKAYGTVSYRNRRTTYTGYYNPSTHEGGASISYEVARW